jgi:hypothetical protein
MHPASLPRWLSLHATVLAAAAALAAMAALPEARAPISDTAEHALDTITAEDLRSHVRFLASDRLQGRGVAHEGNRLAERYLSEAMGRLRLQSEAPDYFQAYDLYGVSLGANNALAIQPAASDAKPSRIEVGDDFSPMTGSGSGEVAGDVVFAGYGISAPAFHYDDYAGLDVTGRIVVVLDHEPQEHDEKSRFNGRARTAYAAGVSKVETAARHGAAALLIVPDVAQHATSRRLNPDREWPANPSVRDRRFDLAETDDEHTLPAALISENLADQLLGGDKDGRSISDLQRAIDQALSGRTRETEIRAPASFTAGTRATLTVRIDHERIATHNVVGYVPGSDPERRSELVVVAAHFDHDGLDSEGRIYNGADDDASGTAGVLEVADAFAQAAAAGARPKRTVVFALWNAEERGMLGSRYYVRHPVPAGHPVANINLDMIGRDEEVLDPTDPRFRGLPKMTAAENRNVVHMVGYSYSPELSALIDRENETIGLTIKRIYDTHEQNLLRRSDHWSFLERGVPAAFFITGLHPDYHTPNDDVEKINFVKMEKITRLVYRVAWQLAERDVPVKFVDVDNLELKADSR